MLAAVALVVSVGMASAQQRTPQPYDKSAAASDLQSKTPDRPSTATPLDQGNGNWNPLRSLARRPSAEPFVRR